MAIERREHGAAGEPEYGLVSDRAFVASAPVACAACGERIEVICIHCDGGTDVDLGERLPPFTVSNIWAMDSALAAQLGPWRHFRRAAGMIGEDPRFANHCSSCGAVQEDDRLHTEPGDVFFDVPAAGASLALARLSGTVRLSGDYALTL